MASKRNDMVMQLEMHNSVSTLSDLERIYLPMFTSTKNRKAGLALLSLVHKHCIVSPFDSTITYPDGKTSISSLGELLRFFVCSKKVSEMPPDAPTFLVFLKNQRFPTDTLCMVQMDK
jgi:hypothetical protein